MEAFLIASGMVWLTVWLYLVVESLIDMVFKPEFVKGWFDSPMYNLNKGYWYKATALWVGLAVIALAWPVIIIYKGPGK